MPGSSGWSAISHAPLDRRSARALGLVCLVLLVGAALRFHDLGAESYWTDELITVRVAAEGPGAVVDSFVDKGRPPVHLFLTSLWMRLAGTTEFSTRYLSVFAGTMSIAVIYAIGREMFSRRVGLISGVLAALSEFQILYSQEVRYYSLFLTFTLLSFYFYIRAGQRNDRLSRVLHALATITLFYTHKYGLFVIVAQNLHSVARFLPVAGSPSTRGWRAWLASQLAVVLAILPALRLGETVRGDIHNLGWVDDPSPGLLGVTLLRYVGSRFPAQATMVAAAVFLILGCLAYMLTVGKGRWLAYLRALPNIAPALLSKRSELVLLVLWLLCPTLIPWALSKVVRPIYVIRYTIGAAPAFYLILAVMASTIRRVLPAPVVLGFVAILIGPGLHEYYLGVTKEDWRGAAQYVDEHVRTGDAVVVPHIVLGRGAFDWYYDGPILECEMDGSRRDSATVIATANRCAGESSRLWLIYRAFMLQGTSLDEADWRAADLRLVERPDFRGVPVYLFERVEEDRDSSYLQRRLGLHHLASSPWASLARAGSADPTAYGRTSLPAERVATHPFSTTEP